MVLDQIMEREQASRLKAVIACPLRNSRRLRYVSSDDHQRIPEFITVAMRCELTS